MLAANDESRLWDNKRLINGEKKSIVREICLFVLITSPFLSTIEAAVISKIELSDSGSAMQIDFNGNDQPT